MKKVYFATALIGVLLFSNLSFSASFSLDLSKLSDKDLYWIGDEIFQNETNRQTKYLTHWNEGEEFPSFGIGHFIWLPDDVPISFQQTFPQMVQHVSQQVPAPKWLSELDPFVPPWKSRDDFYQVWQDQDLAELRVWLAVTKQQQTAFIVEQLQVKFSEKLASLPLEQATKINNTIQRLAESKLGLFLIIDYYNFKGLGFNPKETYQGKGWGLLDIIQIMSAAKIPPSSYEKVFVETGKDILQRRIYLSLSERQEQRWREGWFKRLDTNLTAEN